MKELGECLKKEEALKNEFRFASSSIWPILSEVFWLGSLWAVSSLVFAFNRTYFHFVQGVYKEMSGQPLLFAGDAVGVWGDRTDCWSSHKHQSGYQGIGNSASRSRAQRVFWR